jgi:DNA transformation protein
MAEGFQAQLEELFAPLEGVSFRKMFGGLGIFRQGIMFALVADGVLYLKADQTNAPAYDAEGSRPWAYEGMGKPHVMPYWRLPDRLFDEPEEFRDWALAAFAAAERGKAGAPRKTTPAKKPAARKKPPPKARSK